MSRDITVLNWLRGLFPPDRREQLYRAAGAVTMLLFGLGVLTSDQAAQWAQLGVSLVTLLFAALYSTSTWRTALYAVTGPLGTTPGDPAQSTSYEYDNLGRKTREIQADPDGAGPAGHDTEHTRRDASAFGQFSERQGGKWRLFRRFEDDGASGGECRCDLAGNHR